MTPANPYGEEDSGLPRLSTGSEANTAASGVLARIYQSLAEFTVLTGLLRKTVDARLGERLEVTGWSDGILRVRLDQPALATRWRFQEPVVLRQLKRQPQFRDLREIRLVLIQAPSPPPATPHPLSRTLQASAPALRALADSEDHGPLRRALLELAAAAEASNTTAGQSTAPTHKKPS